MGCSALITFPFPSPFISISLSTLSLSLSVTIYQIPHPSRFSLCNFTQIPYRFSLSPFSVSPATYSPLFDESWLIISHHGIFALLMELSLRIRGRLHGGWHACFEGHKGSRNARRF